MDRCFRLADEIEEEESAIQTSVDKAILTQFPYSTFYSLSSKHVSSIIDRLDRCIDR